MDLSKLSAAQLRDLQQQLEHELTQRDSEERATALKEIHAIAQRVGLPLSELVGNGGQRLAGVARSARGGRTGTVAAQYRNPADATQQWTGRGRQPKWVKEWVDAGNDIAGIRI